MSNREKTEKTILFLILKSRIIFNIYNWKTIFTLLLYNEIQKNVF